MALGEAFLDIKGNTQPFRDDLDTLKVDVSKIVASVKVTLDASLAYDQVAALVDYISEQRPRMLVGLDATQADLDLDALRAEIDRTIASVQVVANVSEAQAAVAAVQAESAGGTGLGAANAAANGEGFISGLEETTAAAEEASVAAQDAAASIDAVASSTARAGKAAEDAQLDFQQLFVAAIAGAVAFSAPLAGVAAGFGLLFEGLKSNPQITAGLDDLKTRVSDALTEATAGAVGPIDAAINHITTDLVTALDSPAVQAALTGFADTAAADLGGIVDQLTAALPTLLKDASALGNALASPTALAIFDELGATLQELFVDIEKIGPTLGSVLLGAATAADELVSALEPVLQVVGQLNDVTDGFLGELLGGAGLALVLAKFLPIVSTIQNLAKATLALSAADDVAAASAGALATAESAVGAAGVAGAVEGATAATGLLGGALEALATVTLPEVVAGIGAVIVAAAAAKEIAQDQSTPASKALVGAGQPASSFGNVQGSGSSPNGTAGVDDLGRPIQPTGITTADNGVVAANTAATAANAAAKAAAAAIDAKYADTIRDVSLAFEDAGTSARTSTAIQDAFQTALEAGQAPATAFASALEAANKAGEGFNLSSTISQLKALGDTNDQIVDILEQVGLTAQEAYNAVNDANFSPLLSQLDVATAGAYALANGLQLAAAEAQIAADAAFHATGQQGPTPLVGGVSNVPTFSATGTELSGGLGAGPLTSSSAASAAKTAATTLANATQAFHQSLSDFDTAVGGAQTVAAVDSAFATLQTAINTEDKALGKTEPKGLKTYLAKQQTELEKSAQAIQLGLSERTQFLADATVAVANPNIAGVNGIITQLRGQVANSTEFSADLKKLAAEHLNETALNQLLAVGPTSAGLQAANDLLHATAAQISTINGLQSQAGLSGESLGTTLGASFETAGQQAAKGLVDGLTSSLPALETAMHALAETMDATIKKDLGIHSPSTVFAQHGRDIVAGLAAGIAGSSTPVVPIPALGRVGAGLGGIVQNVGGIQITISGDISNPTRTGTKLGEAIAAVLAQRKLTTALAG